MKYSRPFHNRSVSSNVRKGKMFSRRELLQNSVAAGGALLVGFKSLLQDVAPERTGDSFQSGQKLGTVEFTDEARVPMGTAFGSELDERLYTDLAKLAPGNLITPTDEFYIRTGASKLLDRAPLSSVKLGGLAQKPSALSAAEISRQAKTMGAHLMECAGNTRAIHFGMMSVAEWSGVPIADVIDSVRPNAAASHILISGFDEYEAASKSSIPGASWIFAIDDLKSAQAFLATEMNGKPLTRDHGAPVRLVVPGWYGCACIKWVNEITIVREDSAATSQMQEYAARTMQKGVPQLARDFQPAKIDAAATPVRIEKWSVGEKLKYRVVGIVWGGTVPLGALEIRFNPEEDFVRVDHVDPPAKSSWSLWTHAWTPPAPGPYIIRLRVKDSRIPARRLDVGAYVRSVEITEV